MSFAGFSVQTFITRVINILAVVLGGVINARWLGVETVGALALLSLIPSFAFFYGNLGFGSAISFYVAKKKISRRRSVQFAFIVSSLMSVISCITILFIWWLKFSPWNDIPGVYIYLYMGTIPLTFYTNFINRILSGELRILETNISNFILSFSNLILLIALVIYFKMEIIGAIFAVLSSQLISLVYLTSRVCRKSNMNEKCDESDQSKGHLIGELWSYGKWNYLLLFTNYIIDQLPIILLKNISINNVSVGLFSKARGLGEQTSLVTEPIAQVLFPVTASSLESEAKQRTNLLCRVSLVVMILFATIMIVIAKEVIYVLYGTAFIPAADIFYVLAPGIIFWPIARFLGVHIAALGMPKLVFIASLSALLTGGPVCYVLILYFGTLGAGLSVSVLSVLWTFYRMMVYCKITKSLFKDILIPLRSDVEVITVLIKRILPSKIKKKLLK